MLPKPVKPSAEFVAEPFAHVKLKFETPPAGLFIVVQRKTSADKFWIVLLGPGRDTEAMDSNPPASGAAAYRIVYQSATGAQGDPSPKVRIERH